MRYSNDQEVRMGDIVRFGLDDIGTVVCSIDTDEYSDEYTESDWSYLKSGVMIVFAEGGLMHFDNSEGLSLVSGKNRGSSLSS